MRSKKPRHKRKLVRPQIALLCAEVGPEDGVDPRTIRRQTSPDRAGRKTLQLCKQVQRALSLVLAGDIADPILRDLSIVEVTPAPDSSRLSVQLELDPVSNPADPATVIARLAGAAGRIRCEIAAAIHRKKTPELSFCIVPINYSNRVPDAL